MCFDKTEMWILDFMSSRTAYIGNEDKNAYILFIDLDDSLLKCNNTVSNAESRVLDSADYVTYENNKDRVAKWIYNNLLENKD